MDTKKQCTLCYQEKELKFFSKDKQGKYGVKSRCKVCLVKYNKEYRNENPEIIKQYYIDNKEKINIQSKQDYEKNKEKHNIRVKKWRVANNNKMNAHFRNRRKTDINFRLKERLRYHLWKYTKGYKTQKCFDLLGCNIDEFRNHIEHKFQEGMNWDNHGKVWELDHIIPCSKFNLTKFEEQQKCFHYSNLQPLWKTTEIAESFGHQNEMGNRNKSNKM